MNDDFHAVLGTVKVASRNENVDRHPVDIGTNEDIAMGYGKHAHKLSVFAFQNLHNLAFGLAVVAFGKHGHTHMVTMQGLIGVLSRDEDVLTFAVVAHHVSLARRLHLNSAFHIFRLWPKLRHACVAHHIAERSSLLQQAFVFQVDKQVIHDILPRLVLDTHDFADLLVVLGAKRLVGENAQDYTCKSA